MSRIHVVTRGDTFRRVFTLSNSNPDGDPWTFGMFSRAIWTLRTAKLTDPLADLTDETALAQVSSDQATELISGLDDCSLEEDPSDETKCILRVGPAITTKWPLGTWHHDIQFVIDGAVPEVFSEDWQMLVQADVGRRTTF